MKSSVSCFFIGLGLSLKAGERDTPSCGVSKSCLDWALVGFDSRFVESFFGCSFFGLESCFTFFRQHKRQSRHKITGQTVTETIVRRGPANKIGKVDTVEAQT